MSVRHALAHRNLLYLLSLKELRTRYRQSVLGWAWSLLNPLSQVAIFSVLFVIIFKAEIPVGDPSGMRSFPLYFLIGLIPFQFFSISVTVSMSAVRGGAGLIKKVAFPHEHLVFAIIIAQFVTMLIELGVLSIALLIGGNMVLPWLLVAIPLLLLLAVFTAGVALALSAANVYFHDVNYLWGITAQLLFYATPIIYNPSTQLADHPLLKNITNYGPTGSFIRAMHAVLYDLRMPGAGRWAYLTVLSVCTFAAGSWVFDRLSPRFAEEL
jgi:ABC-type polysaccharide/polyol phosphate export permease